MRIRRHMRLKAATFLWAALLMTSSHQPPGDFQPSGNWNVNFTGQAFGGSSNGREQDVKGDMFDPTLFFGGDVLTDIVSITGITLNYNQSNQTLSITAGGSPKVRNIRIGNDLTGVSSDSIDSKTETLAPGCEQRIGTIEWIGFKDSSNLEFYWRYFFAALVPDSSSPAACIPVLQRLRQDIQNGSADEFWIALSKTNAIDLNRIDSLKEAGIFFVFEGARVPSPNGPQ